MDGATNGAPGSGPTWPTCLVPALTPGDTVVMDNLAAHKVAGIRQLGRGGRERACYTCRPTAPTSTRSSNAFAKLKALLRTAAARTVPDLWTAIRNAFSRFKPDECRNYIAAAGYDVYDPA